MKTITTNNPGLYISIILFAFSFSSCQKQADTAAGFSQDVSAAQTRLTNNSAFDGFPSWGR